MDKINLQVVRESFGRVVYSHKTHEKEAEITDSHVVVIKWINIVLTTLTSGSWASAIIVDQVILIYISTFLSAIALAFTIFQLSFNLDEKAERHRQLAKELWYIRERYVNLIADIISEKISEDTIISRRNEIIEELKLIYKFAPITSQRAYKKAQEALKINEELTFSDSEVDQFLPSELKIQK